MAGTSGSRGGGVTLPGVRATGSTESLGATPSGRRNRFLTRAGEVLANRVQLGSDRDRHGQEAFEASPFSRLVLTHVLSSAGDALVTLALAGSLFFNISLHAARGRVALSLLFTILPFAIVAPFLGPIIDRTRGGRRLMVFASAVGRCIACLLMARYIHGLLLFPAAFLTLVSSKAYLVAKAALVPATVTRPDDLVEANSKLTVAGSIVGFLAAIPGVAILKLFSASVLLRFDVAVFVLCALSALRLQTRTGGAVTSRSAPESAPASRPEPRVTRRPSAPGAVQAASVAMATLRFTVGFMTFLVAFGFRRNHAPAWWFGVILAFSVGGNLIGAAIAPRLRMRFREELMIAGSLVAVVAAGIAALNLTNAHGRPAASLLAAVIGIAAGCAKLAFDSLVQRDVPAVAQGRAFGRFEAAFQLVWVVGALVPVIIPMSLWAGFLIVTLAAAGAVTVYLAGNRLARVGRLPAWWPGGDRSAPPHGARPAAEDGPGGSALGGAVGEVRGGSSSR